MAISLTSILLAFNCQHNISHPHACLDSRSRLQSWCLDAISLYRGRNCQCTIFSSHYIYHMNWVRFPSPIMSSTTINFITGNKNKLAETRAILGDTVQLSNQNVEILEIQGSLEEIARDKCRKAAIAVCQFEVFPATRAS